ncbi:hypothetical protein Q4E40_02535 [Pontibacter sp. BT731]|uniref:SGNH/GDSL hydrolase family protein n=1 Tax=Pontibacter coccineus TaxID=3063328 RepID=UPI0026E33229|nr:GDSL-type esterase/lipase family protein [Pontibacter sp. BT731]MDO6388989.1 hypothetical protein [Pontibacter sp. BT731]
MQHIIAQMARRGASAPATPAETTAFDYSTTSSGFAHTVYDYARTGYRGRSALAEVSHQTNHTTLAVTWHTQGSTSPPLLLNVYVNGGHHAVLTPTGGATFSTASCALPAGTKTVLLRQGGTWPVSGAVRGADITGATYSGGTFATASVPARKASRMVTCSDSIGVGAGTANNGRYAWQVLLREQLPGWEFASMGAAGAGAAIVQNPNDAQRLVNYLSGANRKVLWWALGTNDYNADPATWGANLANWLESVHALDPAIEVKVQTMIWREGFETQVEPLRQQMRDIAAARSWCQLVEASNWIPIDQYYPDALKVHPNEQGNETFASRVKDVLTTQT